MATARPAVISAVFALACAGAAGAQDAAPALGPHLDGDAYTQMRGGFPDPIRIAWARQTGDVDAEPDTPDARTLTVGPGYAFDAEAGALYDFAAARHVSLQEDGAMENAALHAEVRRRLDIYTALSDGGRRDLIAFGAAGEFDRFWLEAAMGLRAEPVELVVEASEGDVTVRRSPATRVIAQAEAGACFAALDARARASVAGWMRHAWPMHPDVFDALVDPADPPCSAGFIVYSPESPEGRQERWSVVEVAPAEEFDPFGEAAASPPGPVALTRDAAAAGFAAARGAIEAPSPADFALDARLLDQSGDGPGALLTIVRESAHFGPCPDQALGSARLACTLLGPLTRRTGASPDLSRVRAGVAAAGSDRPEAAVEALKPELTREGAAGAAARTLVAGALVAWGREGLEAHRDLDPARLLAEAIALDPFAPEAYWRFGERFLAAGDALTAWAFFDLGRALPGREPTPSLARLSEQETRLEALAPAFFAPAPDAGRAEAEASAPVEAAPESLEKTSDAPGSTPVETPLATQPERLLDGFWPRRP